MQYSFRTDLSGKTHKMAEYAERPVLYLSLSAFTSLLVCHYERWVIYYWQAVYTCTTFRYAGLLGRSPIPENGAVGTGLMIIISVDSFVSFRCSFHDLSRPVLVESLRSFLPVGAGACRREYRGIPHNRVSSGQGRTRIPR